MLQFLVGDCCSRPAVTYNSSHARICWIRHSSWRWCQSRNGFFYIPYTVLHKEKAKEWHFKNLQGTVSWSSQTTTWVSQWIKVSTVFQQLQLEVSWCYKQCFDSKFPQVCSKPWSHLFSTVAKATHWVAKAWRGAWDKSGPLLKCTQLQYIIMIFESLMFLEVFHFFFWCFYWKV